MKHKQQQRKNSFLLLLLIVPVLSIALPSDKNAPLHISANTANFSEKTGQSVFIGNVIITQGTTTITANKLTTITDKQHKLIKAIAIGKPATYTTLPKKGGKLFHASADQIQYLPKKNRVILLENAKLKHGNNDLQSNYIVYNQKTGRLDSKLYKNQRTNIVLQP